MTKAEVLHIFATAIVRELLREDEPTPTGTGAGRIGPAGPPPTNDQGPDGPQPRFDFDESPDLCEHNGVYITRSLCPVHGDDAREGVTPEELDDITADEPPSQVARAERLRRQRQAQARREKLFPEDIPMSGLAPPDDLP